MMGTSASIRPGAGLTLQELVAGLAPTLGREKSEELVHDAARTLGFAGRDVDPAGVFAVIDLLGASTGVVGLIARLAGARYARQLRRTSNAPARPAASSSSSSPHRERLIQLFAPALGNEKSAEVVDAAAGKLGIEPRALAAADAQRIVESLAAASGIVGVAARLAKARMSPR